MEVDRELVQDGQEFAVVSGTVVFDAFTRMWRYPFATAAGLLLIASIAYVGSWLKVSAPWFDGFGFTVFSTVAGSGAVLLLSAFMTMDEKRLGHLKTLSRDGFIIASVFGVVLAVILYVAGKYVPESIVQDLSFFTPGRLSTFLVGGSAALLISAAPPMLLAWPVAARSGTSILEVYLELGTLSSMQGASRTMLTAVIAAVGGAACYLPYVGLVVPVYLAHLMAEILEHFLEAKK